MLKSQTIIIFKQWLFILNYFNFILLWKTGIRNLTLETCRTLSAIWSILPTFWIFSNLKGKLHFFILLYGQEGQRKHLIYSYNQSAFMKPGLEHVGTASCLLKMELPFPFENCPLPSPKSMFPMTELRAGQATLLADPASPFLPVTVCGARELPRSQAEVHTLSVASQEGGGARFCIRQRMIMTNKLRDYHLTRLSQSYFLGHHRHRWLVLCWQDSVQ